MTHIQRVTFATTRTRLNKVYSRYIVNDIPSRSTADVVAIKGQQTTEREREREREREMPSNTQRNVRYIVINVLINKLSIVKRFFGFGS